MKHNQNQTVACFQWLRVFAALGVVMIHVSALSWYTTPLDGAQWAALTLWNSLVRWPVPVFLMISGALFLPRVTTLKTALTRYIPRTAATFLIWSSVYALWALLHGTPKPEALLKLVSGEYHLWYLPFLCGFYLTVPFMQKLVTDPRLEDQLLAVGIVVGLVIPWLADLGAALRPDWGSILRAVKNNLHYTFFFDLLALPVLGHRLCTRELSPRLRHLLYLLGLTALLLNGPAAIWLSRRLGERSSLLFDHASPTTFFAAAAVFVFAGRHLTRLPRAVDVLARLSFGVYLIHPLVLNILQEWEISALSFPPIWFVPVLSAAVFALSLALSAVLAKIPLIGKWMT